MRAALVAVCLASPLSAESLVGPNDFSDFTEGYTLYFERHDTPYGAEQYLPGRQVIWQYADGTCTHGAWYAEGDALCFFYENDPAPQCWHFSRRGGGFYARVRGLAEGDPSELQMSARLRGPLDCTGPDLGV